MSDDITKKPGRPTNKTTTTSGMPEAETEWTAEFYRRKGWKSKRAAQGTLRDELKPTIEAGLAALFLPKAAGSADSLKDLVTRNPLKHTRFRSYRAALEDYEKGKDSKRDAKSAEELRKAAQNYVDHSDKDFDQDELDDKDKRQRRLNAAKQTLADLKKQSLLRNMQELPWDSETAMLAASMKAEADLSSLPTGQQFAEQLQGDGVNPTFWINKTGATGQPEKTFLFKPATDKGQDRDRDGVPNGGEPAREALSGRAADLLGVMMSGVDFKFPETQIVNVDKRRFGQGALGAQVVGRDGDAPLVGSLQQFAPNSTQMRRKPPSMKHAVPAQRCQELAVLDLTMLHVDRHGGNFMMTGDEDAADLIPIDNGLAFPEGTKDLERYMATSHNALLQMPGSHQKFSDEMLGRLLRVDPKMLGDALKGERNSIEQVHASSQGLLSDKAITQSERSMAFLKLAAPKLTPAAVQVALGRNAAELLDTQQDDQKFQAAATRIIDAMVKDQQEIADYFLMTKEEAEQLEAILASKGWTSRDYDNPIVAMKLFKSGATKSGPAKTEKDWDGTSDQAQMKAAILEMKKVFPKAPDAWVTTWVEFQKLGGMAAVAEAKERLGVPTALTDGVIRTPSVKGCYAYLQYSRTVTETTANIDTKKGEDRFAAQKIVLLKSMVASMAAADQAPALKLVTALERNAHNLDSKTLIERMNRARDKIIGLAQPALRQVLADLPPSTDEAINKSKSDADGAIETGSIVEAMKILDKLKATLNPEQVGATNGAVANDPADDDEKSVAEKLKEHIARVRTVPGQSSYSDLLTTAETALAEGRLDDANELVRKAMGGLRQMRDRIKAVREANLSGNLVESVAAAERYFVAGRLADAQAQLSRIERLTVS